LAPKITKLCFGFEIFCHQNIGAKCTRKMVMKLTTEVDFTNFYAPICMVKFAKLICRLQSARHLPKKASSHLACAKRPRKYVGEIDS